MTRREFPAKVMVAAFERSMGSCEACGGLLVTGRINYDHVIPEAIVYLTQQPHNQGLPCQGTGSLPDIQLPL